MTPMNQPVTYCSIGTLWTQFYNSVDYASRTTDVANFNAANRWRSVIPKSRKLVWAAQADNVLFFLLCSKRGLSIAPLKYGLGWTGLMFSVYIAINKNDGSIYVSQGGVEIGQGSEIKLMQAVAYELGVDLSLVVTGPSDTIAQYVLLLGGAEIRVDLTETMLMVFLIFCFFLISGVLS